MERKNSIRLFMLLFPLSFIPWFISAPFLEHVLLILLVYVFIPLAVSKILGFAPSEVGMRLPNRNGLKLSLILLALSIPLSLYGRTIPSMKHYYPIFPYSGIRGFVLSELGMGLIMFAHESFYRGFLLFPLAGKNERLAILLQDLPYTLVHLGKPGIEVPYAFIAGIVFAKIDIKGGSIVPSFLLHWIGSAIFDVLCAFT